VGLSNHLLDESTHWRHLTNTIERFVHGGIASVSNYFDHLFLFLCRVGLAKILGRSLLYKTACKFLAFSSWSLFYVSVSWEVPDLKLGYHRVMH